MIECLLIANVLIIAALLIRQGQIYKELEKVNVRTTQLTRLLLTNQTKETPDAYIFDPNSGDIKVIDRKTVTLYSEDGGTTHVRFEGKQEVPRCPVPWPSKHAKRSFYRQAYTSTGATPLKCPKIPCPTATVRNEGSDKACTYVGFGSDRIKNVTFWTAASTQEAEWAINYAATALRNLHG